MTNDAYIEKEIKRIAQRLAFGQDVSGESSLLITAARLYLQYQKD